MSRPGKDTAPGVPAIKEKTRGREAKYVHMARGLVASIESGDLEVGEKLPPMKELAETYSVSLVTAFRAVQLLANDGMVATRGGRDGTVVMRKKPMQTVANTAIACLLRPPRMRTHEDDFALDMIHGVRKAISENDFCMLYHGLDEARYEERVSQLLSGGQVRGCLIDQLTPLSTIQRLAALGTPTVLMNRHEDVPGLSTVSPAYEDIGRDTAKLLLKKGYQQLGFYKVPRGEEAFDEAALAAYYALFSLRRGFLDEARAQGVAEDDILLFDEPRDQEAAVAPETYGFPTSRPAGWRRLGILTASDSNAISLLNALQKTELKLAEDVGVIGCYDLEIGRRAPVQPSTWYLDPTAVGRRAVRELIGQLDAPDVVTSVQLRATYRDRGTA